jgi:hypothetical protein
MIRLYHFSSKNFKGFIEPGYYGENNYTRNDKNITELKRAFYYIGPGEVEYLLSGSNYLYITEVKPGDIYDLTEDKKGYLKQSRGNIDKALRLIKRNYRGVIYSLGNYKVVNLFTRAKIKQRKTLTEAGKNVIFKRKGLQVIPGNLQE